MVSNRLKAVLILVSWLSVSLVSAATINQLTATPFITDIKISPTGEFLAVRIFDEGKHHIRFMALSTFEQLGGISFPGSNEVGNFYWVNDERVVAKVLDHSNGLVAPRYYGELFAANYDGSDAKLIFGYRTGNNTAATHMQRDDAEYAWADIVDVLPDEKRKILISSTDMSKSFDRRAEAVPLNTYSGKVGRRIKESAFPGGDFHTDKDGQIRLVTSYASDSSLHLQALPVDAKQWIDVPKSRYGDYFTPVAITDDKKSVYVLDNLDSDRIGLHKLSLDGARYENIYTHEEVDITNVVLSADGRSVYGIRVDNGYPGYLVFSKSSEEAATFKSLLQYFSGAKVSVRSRSRDGRLWIVRVSTDVDAGSFHLFDSDTNTIRKLFDSRPDLNPGDLAPTEPIEFQSFDDRKIAGYFTAAKGSEEETPPLVVLVHGGPIVRDYWGYDPEVQALATNGFSVLQINYRGSRGYGLQFKEAGYRHWGDDIQKDIIAGTRWAIAEQRATQGNICIMGGSFGAYSALQSAILAPDLFNCAVANAGIYDLPLLYKKGDIETSYWGEEYLEKAIGRDPDELARFSPVNRVSELQAPVMIAHGTRDERAPFEHAKRLRDALDEHGKTYKWFVKRREGHGFYENDNQVEYLESALAFLNKHLTKPGTH